MAKIVGYGQAPSFVARMQGQSLFGLGFFDKYSKAQHDALYQRCYALFQEGSQYTQPNVAGLKQLLAAQWNDAQAIRSGATNDENYQRLSVVLGNMESIVAKIRSTPAAPPVDAEQAVTIAPKLPDCGPLVGPPALMPDGTYRCPGDYTPEEVAKGPKWGADDQLLLAIYNRANKSLSPADFGMDCSRDIDGKFGDRSMKALASFAKARNLNLAAEPINVQYALRNLTASVWADAKKVAEIKAKVNGPCPGPKSCPAGTKGVFPNCTKIEEDFVEPPPEPKKASVLTYGLIGAGVLVVLAAMLAPENPSGSPQKAVKNRRHRR